jgi:hypothetical protein
MRFRNGFRQQKSKIDRQRHHIIPVAVFSNKHFAQDFEIMKRLKGFDPADFGTNGIFLPSTEIAALQTGRPLHRGPHPQYNEFVAHRVAAIFRKKAGLVCDVSRQHRLLRDFQQSLFKSLSGNLHNIILNRRDPLARDVDFRCLDEDLAILLQAKFPN